MAKPELGNKHTCVSCGARFFDLGNVPAICPKCGTEQPAEQPKLKRNVPIPEDVKKQVKPASVVVDEVEVDAADDAGDEDLLADADDLEDDADGIETDIEVERDPDENER
ncbi:MAG: TIGR02300 family protein [Acidiphilium sp.]